MARPARGVVPALSIATALAMFGDMTMYTVLPSHHAALGISLAAVGVLLSVHRFIRLGANSIGGVLSDRIGRRRPFLLGMALAFASTAGYLLADGFWPLLASRLVWGLAFALLSVGGLSILLDITTPADRGRTVGTYHALVQVGTMLALLLAGVLADVVGYRATLAVFTPLAALGWAIAHLALRETRPDAGPAAGGARGLSLPAAWRGIDRRLLVPCFVSFAAFFAGNGVLMATIGLHVKSQPLLVPLATLTGILLASRKLAAIVSAPLAGYLSDRVERRRVAAGGVAIGLAGFLVLALGHGLGAVVVGVALTALGEGILLPSLAAWAGDLTPASLRGLVMGGFATANDLGGATGPVVGYAVGAALGLRPAYGLCALLFVSALVVLVAVGPDPRRARIVGTLETPAMSG